MTTLCLAAAALTVALPVQSLTLAWTHSIEKIRWEEDYRVAGQLVELTEARIRGSGAGMEIPAEAVLEDGVWHYRPALGPLPAVRLTRSPYAADYVLCWEGRCHAMKEFAGSVDDAPLVELRTCSMPVTIQDSP